MVSQSLLLTCVLLGQPSGQGAIEGTVTLVSDGRLPAAGAEVVLRVAMNGQFVPLAETTTDEQGRFRFAPLPVGPQYVYLPGANRHGVHYPGQRIQLTAERPRREAALEIRDVIEGPSPLVALRHEIVIRPEPGALTVSEKILVDNPTAKCYVGRPAPEPAEPVTLRLAIPPDFERVTFDKEFFGRRFSLVRGELVTGIPWQPGSRELAFTYVLRNDQRHRVYERPLDLACPEVVVRVLGDDLQGVSCSLAPEASPHGGEVLFESHGRTLPAGQVIRVELGRLPVGFMTYGRWLAPLVLVALIGGTTLVTHRRRKAERQATLRPAHSAPVSDRTRSARVSRTRRKRTNSRRC